MTEKVTTNRMSKGFTLIEMSIVLVIIGLLVGGALAGQDLIRSAGVRATITQIERYNTAANTFRGKYDYLPGDIKDPDASSYGLAPRGFLAGQGDGNGVIEGNANNGSIATGGTIQCGEPLLFWSDLSQVGLIEGSYSLANATVPPNNYGALTQTSTPSLSAYVPQAVIGRSNYIFVWSGGWNLNISSVAAPDVTHIGDGENYFVIQANPIINGGWSGSLGASPGLTVEEAYRIDTKMDDGLPQSGNVLALFTGDANPYWAGFGGPGGSSPSFMFPPPASGQGSGATSSSCFDSGGVGGAVQYSVEMNTGAKTNCALSFKFQ